MRVLFFSDGRPGDQSVAHRGTLIFDELSEEGFEAEIVTQVTLPATRRVVPNVRAIFKAYANLKSFDAVIFHRVANSPARRIQLKAKRLGIPTYYDYDDAVFLSKSPTYSHFEEMLRDSRAVAAGSHFLLAYAGRFSSNAFLLPTPVDDKLFHPRARKTQQNSLPVIGWLGHGWAHAENLAVIVEPLRELSRRMSFRLEIVSWLGNDAVKKLFADAPFEVDLGERGWIPLSEIPRRVGRFDVGIMPLIDTEFNRGKCAMKALEYMAMGIPAVASDVGENRHVISDGETGFVVHDGSRWVSALESVLSDEDLARRMGIAGRALIEQRYASKVVAAQWKRILQLP